MTVSVTAPESATRLTADPIDDPAFRTFFLPGPTAVHADVLAAMTRPMMSHRGKAFEAMFARIQTGLRDVFKTARPVFVSTSAATGLMEAAIRCAPEGRILSIVGGAFGERFAQIGQQCGREVDVMAVPLGRAADPDAVAATLRDARYAAVTVVHSESSTGALTNVEAVAAAAREAGVLIFVDSVTGIGAAPLHADAWELDFVLTGSQKALALPPGLAFGVASERYMATAARAANRGMYFDLVEFEEYAAKNQTPNTPALPLLYALDAQMQRMQNGERIEARWVRHAEMAAQLYAWTAERADSLGVGILAPDGERSPSVSAVTLPNGITGDDVVRGMADRGFVVGNGYGPLRETTFRIGHMGDHTPATLAGCLAMCDEALGLAV